MAELLQAVYRAEASAPVPGDPAPEIVEAEHATQDLAGRKVPSRGGFRANVKQRRAIELRAMRLAAKHYSDRGASVRDTSATKPFDLEVTSGTATLSVEVKRNSGRRLQGAAHSRRSPPPSRRRAIERPSDRLRHTTHRAARRARGGRWHASHHRAVGRPRRCTDAARLPIRGAACVTGGSLRRLDPSRGRSFDSVDTRLKNFHRHSHRAGSGPDE